MKLLLHTCCAPCEIFPLEQLRNSGFEVAAFFYNPNIHPLSEYNNRRQAVEDFSKAAGLEAIFPEYRPQEFFQAVSGKEFNPGRCESCWGLRLNRTAQEARKTDCTHFSTTLLVSPYQDQGIIKEMGEDAARNSGIEFYYEDFRPGFRKAHDQAKSKGIYCQKYCGCIYSEIERCKKSGKSS
jgi:predicted adenine nucleotide alpha hydrolase (AANH) superfamily ATPase